MTGPEHYREAERLLAEAAVEGVEGTYFVRPENLAAAQAHATLAHAAIAVELTATIQMKTLGDVSGAIDDWSQTLAKTIEDES